MLLGRAQKSVGFCPPILLVWRGPESPLPQGASQEMGYWMGKMCCNMPYPAGVPAALYQPQTTCRNQYIPYFRHAKS